MGVRHACLQRHKRPLSDLSPFSVSIQSTISLWQYLICLCLGDQHNWGLSRGLWQGLFSCSGSS